MARWVKLAARSFIAAAVVCAAQLGVAQALALLVWSAVPSPDVWRRHLTWLVLIFAAAVLGGVAGGRRSVREIRRAIANRRADAAAARHSGLVAHQRGLRAAQKRAVAAARSKTVDTARGVAAIATRICATVFSALGAAASFALVWLPARNAFAPADMRVLAITAGVGIAVGAILSVLSLAAAPIAANVGVWLIALWVFGLTSVGLAIATDQPTITPRLGVLDAPEMIGPDDWWLGPNLIVAVAAVFGAAVAGTARWLSAHRLAIALSGLTGPAVLAAAYLVVGPAGDLMSSYVAALLAATVGLLTSAVTAAVHPGAGDTAKTAGTLAALTAGPSAMAARRPLAIESGKGAQYPASQYPAADPLYVAPRRAAPVPSARPEPKVAAQRSMPAPTPVPPIPTSPIGTAKAAPAPPPRSSTGRAARPPAPPVQPPARPAAPMAPPPTGPLVSSPVQPASAPPSPPGAPRQRPAQPPTSTASERKPTGRKPSETKPAAAEPADRPAAAKKPVASTPGESSTTKRPAAQKPAAQKPARAKAAAAAKPAQETLAATATTAEKPAGRGSRRRRADRVTTPGRMEHKATTSDEVLPRTARPAEVVAVEAFPKGRRARRRAAKLAAERAAAEERLTRQIEREATTMNKREKEHVDWVKHLVSLPNDPNLTTRQK